MNYVNIILIEKQMIRKANDDNCIDALSGITWQNDIYPYRERLLYSSKKGISRLSFYDIRHIK